MDFPAPHSAPMQNESADITTTSDTPTPKIRFKISIAMTITTTVKMALALLLTTVPLHQAQRIRGLGGHWSVSLVRWVEKIPSMVLR